MHLVPRNRIGSAGLSFAILALVLLSACGGGGGGGSTTTAATTTSISGNVAPVTPLPAAQAVTGGAVSNMVLVPGVPQTTFPAIAQTLDYGREANLAPLIKITTASFARPIDTVATLTSGIDPLGTPPSAQPNAISIQTDKGVSIGPVNGQEGTKYFGPLMVFLVSVIFPPNVNSEVIAGYAQPPSTFSPDGYLYQTLGWWMDEPTKSSFVEGYFSAGIPADVTTLLGSGPGTYSGVAHASWVQAATRDQYEVSATINVTVDYAARTVTFGTNATKALSQNADTGAPYVATPDLNMSGTLTYAAGSNTFSGAVISANGMSGNVTGRLYGPRLASAGGGKPMGAPAEIGGTFALKLEGFGAMQGSFGGK
jgi:hypothetical protein